MKTLSFKIAVNGIIYSVSLLELQTLQVKKIDFTYVIE